MTKGNKKITTWNILLSLNILDNIQLENDNDWFLYNSKKSYHV